MEHVGVELSPIRVPYPVYVFEYVSAGGNSSQRTTVTLDTPAIDALIETLSQKIRWRKSAAGQRALMTSRLRNSIKVRDHYTCRYCSVSLAAEPHLLLEVDHIVPISKAACLLPTIFRLCAGAATARSPTRSRPPDGLLHTFPEAV
ncbi:HNH endonuclease family domain protein [Mycobacterium avium MAV_120709_2344]|nr:HNH endonuclease family domain protein [Mycobacterium avium MAV_120709_2344]